MAVKGLNIQLYFNKTESRVFNVQSYTCVISSVCVKT